MSDPANLQNNLETGSKFIATLAGQIRKSALRMLLLAQQPVQAWSEIRNEHLSLKSLMLQHFLTLALLSSCCSFLGNLFEGIPFFVSLLHQLVYFLMRCLLVVFGGILLARLARSFEAAPSEIECSKLLTFSAYPALFGGLLTLIPHWLFEFFAVLCSFYGIYLYWLGTQLNLGIPSGRWVGFFFVSILILGLLFGLLGMLLTFPLPELHNPQKMIIPNI